MLNHLFQEEGLFDHAQGNDFSMFDNLDSFLQEFGNSVSEPGLLSPSPPLSDSGLSNTSSDQMMSPDDNADDDLSEWAAYVGDLWDLKMKRIEISIVVFSRLCVLGKCVVILCCLELWNIAAIA